MFKIIQGFITFNFDLFSIFLDGAADNDYFPVTIYHGWEQHSTCGGSGLKAEIPNEFLHKTAGICRYEICKKHCFIAQCFAQFSEIHVQLILILFLNLLFIN